MTHESAKSGYRLWMDDLRFNWTLLQLLRQDFEIDIRISILCQAMLIYK